MKSSMILIASLMVSTSVFAAPVDPDAVNFPGLSANQSLNFNKSNHSSFGQVISFRVGTTTLAADLLAENPMMKRKSPAVGIMTDYAWNGGVKGLMSFTFNVSTANKMKLKNLLKTAGPELKVEIDYQIYSFDKEADGWIIGMKSFTMSERGALNRTAKDMPKYKNSSYPLQCNAKRTDITVSDAPTKDIEKPVTFEVTVKVSPGGTKRQDVIFSTKVDKYEQIHWGSLD